MRIDRPKLTLRKQAKIHSQCEVQLLKFSYQKSLNEDCTPVLLAVNYENTSQKALLAIKDSQGEKYAVKLLRIKYEFSNEKIAKDSIECLEDSQLYSISIASIDRHVLYGGFKCEINYLKNGQKYVALYNFNIPYFSHKKPAKLCKLDSFFPNESMINIFNHELKEDPSLSTQEMELLSKINTKNLELTDCLKNALSIEDLNQQQSLSKHTLTDVKFNSGRKGKVSFQVDRQSLPENIEETSLCFIPMEKFNKEKFMFNKEGDCAFVWIDKFDGNTVTFSRNKVQVSDPKVPFDTKISYAVRFVPNRITIRASLNALDLIYEKKVAKFFDDFDDIPNKTNLMKFEDKIIVEEDFDWCNKNIESNEEQKLAIKNIVNCTAFPYPYCVFGPPGTGKTSCIVECVLQILKLKPKSKILITAQSNSACNEIGERVLKYLSINKVFRLYSSRMKKINPGGISKNLVRTSNLRSLKESEFPSKDELKHFPVVICTLTTSSQLVRANLKNHFDYIFIDECAATNEPEACIPLVGLGCLNEEITANFLLVGDHLQLRPVITSTFARDHLGLGVSLMERVMTTERYQKDPEYDSKYVTQLLNNYRSHPSILNFSNSEFYNSSLKAKNTSDEVDLGTKWDELPNKQFPIVFHCEKDASVREEGGTSTINEKEVEIVKNYVEKLIEKGIDGRQITEDDIGVITPYKAQLERLRKVLPSKVEIGTTEYYQGREKLIIIISTVKSKTGVGFLRDARRLNVCLTRAKSLMIIVGNADTLQQDETWKRFIHYCKQNRACVGEKFWLKPLKSKIETPSAENEKEVENPAKIVS